MDKKNIKGYFYRFPEAKQLFFTTDGQAFMLESFAKCHQDSLSGNKLDIICYSRSEVNKWKEDVSGSNLGVGNLTNMSKEELLGLLEGYPDEDIKKLKKKPKEEVLKVVMDFFNQ